MHFADWKPLLADALKSEQDFAEIEFSPGLQYYTNRLKRLAFSGKRVLDAGCGMGQYSIALAHVFEQVEGIDHNAFRLGIAEKMCTAMGLHNVRFQKGSVEALPYADGDFDAVFCYGVIMFTDVAQTLRECYRVLAPGGMLYVCLNGDGWNWKILHERCGDNPSLRHDFEKALYTTLVQRHMPVIQQYAAGKDAMAQGQALLNLKNRGIPFEALAGELGSALRTHLPELMFEIDRLSPSVRYVFAEDFFTFLLHGLWPTRFIGKTRSYLPEDIAPLLKEAGFCHWAWAPEALLFCDEKLAEVVPRYEGKYQEHIAVWEFVARKADTELIDDAARILEEAEQAGVPVFCPPLKYPVVYSFTETMSPAIVQKLEKEAARMGESSFFERQISKLRPHATTDEDLLSNIIFYVQKALYRHPVIQPSNREGNLSPLAVLLSGLGRCGHAAALVCAFLRAAQIPCRIQKLRSHIIAEAQIGGRYVIADADAFKHGIIPRNMDGALLSLADIAADPWQIDHFPATGWSCPVTAPQACTPLGYQVHGYVTSGTWHERGYLSNYFTQHSKGYPPSQPVIVECKRHNDQMALRWTPSLCRDEKVLHYEVCVGITSRGWTEAVPNKAILQPNPHDIAYLTTTATHCTIAIPAGLEGDLYVNITAIGERFTIDDKIFYWPGEEIICHAARLS